MKRSLALVAVATLLGAGFAGAGSAQAAGPVVIADWEMNEPVGASVAHDSGPNGIDGAVGNVIKTGQVDGTRTFYRFPFTPPNTTPPDTPRLVVADSTNLNPGTRDFTISFSYRTTHNFGNIIQKGQHGAPGGYFKIEQPNGHLTCLFRGLVNGVLNGVMVNSGVLLDDGLWHSIVCSRTANEVTMTIDGTITHHTTGQSGDISNDVPMTIGGKTNCDQVTITCDFFSGDIDRVEIDTTGVAPPPPPGFVASTGIQSGAKAPKVTVPSSVQAGQLMLLESSFNNTTATASAPAGWTKLGTADASGLASTVWWKVASAADAGSAVTVNLSVATKSTVELLSYAGINGAAPVAAFNTATNTSSTASHTTPTVTAGAGDFVVSLWSDKSSTTTSWTTPGSVTKRDTQIGTGSGYVSSTTADSGTAVTAGTYGALTATTNAAGAKGTMWTIALAPQ